MIQLGSAYGEININASGAMAAINSVGQSLRTLQTTFEQVGRSMTAVGGAMTAAFTAPAAGLAAGIGGAVKTAATFEQAMANVQALSGATEEQFSQLTQTAEELGRTTSFTASEAAEGMGFLAMAGFEANEIVAAMPGLLAAAAAGGLDLARTADITSNILTGFGLAAEDTERVADLLTKTFTSSNVTMEMLGTSMKYVGPLAAGVGLSLEEVSAAVGLLGNAGIQGEQAGTTLRAGLLALTAPTEATKKLMDELGLDVMDAEGNLLSLNDILLNLSQAMAGMTDTQKTAILGELFGREPASGFKALLDAAESGQLAEFTGELENAGGTAQEIADRQLDTLQGSLKLLNSALDGVKIAIGQAFIPVIRSLAETITAFLDQNGEQLTAFFERLAEVLVGFIAGETFTKTLTRILSTGLKVLDWLARLEPHFIAAGVAVGGFLAVAGPALMAFGLMLPAIGAILSPIGILITAMTGLGAAFMGAIASGKQFVAVFEWLGGAVKSGLGQVLRFLDQFIAYVAFVLRGGGSRPSDEFWFMAWLEDLPDGVGAAVLAIGDFIDNLRDKFPQVSSFIGTMITSIRGAVPQVEAAVQKIKAAFSLFWAALTTDEGDLKFAYELFRSGMLLPKDTTNNIIGAALALKNFGQGVTNAVDKIRQFGRTMQAIFEAQGLEGVVNDLARRFRTIGKRVGNALIDGLELAWENRETIATALGNLAASTFTAVQTAFSTIKTTGAEIGANFIAGLVEGMSGQRMSEDRVGAIEGGLNAFALTALPLAGMFGPAGLLASAGIGLATFASQLEPVRAAIDGFVETVSGAFTRIQTAFAEGGFAGVADLFWSWLGGEDGVMTSAPEKINAAIDTINRLFDEQWPKIKATLQKWADGFWNWLLGEDGEAGAVQQGGAALNKFLDTMQAWAEDPASAEKLKALGENIGEFIIDGLQFFVENTGRIVELLEQLGPILLAAVESMASIFVEVGTAIGSGLVEGITNELFGIDLPDILSESLAGTALSSGLKAVNPALGLAVEAAAASDSDASLMGWLFGGGTQNAGTAGGDDVKNFGDFVFNITGTDPESIGREVEKFLVEYFGFSYLD